MASAETVLRVEGESARPLTLRDADFAQLPRTSVQVHDHAGTSVTYAGVLLRDIMVLAGVPLGEQLRGDRLALYLVVEAADGYRLALPCRNSMRRLPTGSCSWRTGVTISRCPRRRDHSA